MWWIMAALAAEPMVLQVVDDATGTPIPCATLTTVHQVRLTTDDEGLAVFVEPGLVGQSVWFDVEARGFGIPADFFGFVGEAVAVTSGGFAQIRMSRTSGAVADCPASDHARRLIDAGLPAAPMRIEVVDRATGRGVPLALVVVGDRSWWTDAAGNIAVVDPQLYGQDLELSAAEVHGYGPSASTTATVVEGAHVVLEVDRHHPAQRLYRITGADPFRDTVLLGLPAPIPGLQGEVVGLDSALAIEVDGAPVWLFGDTLRPSYPLGHFDTSAAFVSGDPSSGVQLDFLVGSDGFSRGVADLSDDGPVWLSIPTSVDDGGSDVVFTVFGVYAADLSVVGRGFAVLDPVSMTFEAVGPMASDVELSHQTPVREGGHVVLREGLRFADRLDAATDVGQWQTWSPWVDGAVERHGDGEARWAWRDGLTVPSDGLAEADQWSPQMVEPDSGTMVTPHFGDIARNTYLGRFVQVFTRQNGEMAWLGELWMSVADTPFGPWSYARQVAGFDDYTLYNPLILDSYDTDGREIFFQGTYTDFFSGAAQRTPRYDYNQLMFSLDLADPRAVLPVAFYREAGSGVPTTGPRLAPTATDPVVAFHAYEREREGTVAVGRAVADCAGGGWATSAVADPLLWGEAEARSGLVALWDDGGALSVEPLPKGVTPLAWVWPATGARHVPAHDYLPPSRLSAGADRCVMEDHAGGGATVVLEAEAAGGEVSWSVEGQEVTGEVASFVLSVGDHVVTAQLLTPEGHVVSDVVLVHVEAASTAATSDTGALPPTTDTGEGGPTSGPTTSTNDRVDPNDGAVKGSDTPAGCGCGHAAGGGGLWVGALWLVGRRRRG